MPREYTPRVPCVCAQCGVTFLMKPSAVAYGYGRFCSVTCRRTDRTRDRVPRTCAHCGTDFLAFPSEVARSAVRFCSPACYQAGKVRPIADRFWEKVDKDGPIPAHRPELGQCWVWTGAKMPRKWPYGLIGSDQPGKGPRRTHQVSWELHIGPIPDGLWVLHKCDNPPCVRPDHLFLGTPLDNMRDKEAKGRGNHRGRPKGSHLSEASLASFRKKRGYT